MNFALHSPATFFSKYDSAVNTACLRIEVSQENELYILDNVTEDVAVEICGGIDL